MSLSKKYVLESFGPEVIPDVNPGDIISISHVRDRKLVAMPRPYRVEKVTVRIHAPEEMYQRLDLERL